MIYPIKCSFYKLARKLLRKKRKEIIKVEYELPKYKIIELDSQGKILEEVETEEKLIITFKTPLYREKEG